MTCIKHVGVDLVGPLCHTYTYETKISKGLLKPLNRIPYLLIYLLKMNIPRSFIHEPKLAPTQEPL